MLLCQKEVCMFLEAFFFTQRFPVWHVGCLQGTGSRPLVLSLPGSTTDGPWDRFSQQEDDRQLRRSAAARSARARLPYLLLLSVNITYLGASESASLQLLSVINTCFKQLDPLKDSCQMGNKG